MYHEILARHHFLTLWERFVNGLIDEHFGDYLEAHLPRGDVSDNFSRRTGWALDHLRRCGWRASTSGRSLDVLFPTPFVMDPRGNLYPLTSTIFVGFTGYPDLPGIPFPARLLFELLSEAGRGDMAPVTGTPEADVP